MGQGDDGVGWGGVRPAGWRGKNGVRGRVRGRGEICSS